MLPDPCQPHNKGLEATLTLKKGMPTKRLGRVLA
jgi:hypothetical protein